MPPSPPLKPAPLDPPHVPFMRVVCHTCAWDILIRLQSHAIVRPRKCGYCGSSRLTHNFVSHFQAFIAAPFAYLALLLNGE